MTHKFAIENYRAFVAQRYPSRLNSWPVLSGYSVKVGVIGHDVALIFKHTGINGFIAQDALGQLHRDVTGIDRLDESNKESVRERLAKHYNISPSDGIIFVGQIPQANGMAEVSIHVTELEALLRRHEAALGLAPMKIFLSHKTADKAFVRDFFETLKQLGFDPWLDEDAMVAGDSRERALLKGFEDSCAVVFFVTENFVDENYLATEIDYAIDQKRKKGDKFSIITLRFTRDGQTGSVPELIKTRFIYKEPKTDLEALRDIIKALPLKLGAPAFK